MIAALFVIKNGPYFNLPNVEPWDESRDAKKYCGPHKVIAHPPCERWGRYWSGGPVAKTRRELGDDNGCFKSALESVRKYSGLLEHPEASHAFRVFGLPRPLRAGSWTPPDEFGGRSCCVAQGHYGHEAQKLTWLYGINIKFDEFIWGLCPGKNRLDDGCHSKEERARIVRTGSCQRLSKRQRKVTPIEFRDKLISMVSS